MLQYILLWLVICLFWLLLLMVVLGKTCPVYSFWEFYVCCIVQSGHNLNLSQCQWTTLGVTPGIVGGSSLYVFVMVL